MPAHAGIQFAGLTARKIRWIYNLDSVLRRNDGCCYGRVRRVFLRSTPSNNAEPLQNTVVMLR